jgi:hypothetical protein
MAAAWADPETAARMRANLEKGRGWNRGRRKGQPPDPTPPAADPRAAPPPAIDPAATPADPRPQRRSLAAAVLTSSPRDLLDKLRGR